MAVHVVAERYGQETSTQKLNFGNIMAAGGLEWRVLCISDSWIHNPGPHLGDGRQASHPAFHLYDCSNICNYITFSCYPCFIGLQLKCKNHPSLLIPSLCCFLTSDFRNRYGPKLTFLSQGCFQKSQNFHVSMTESHQPDNYGEAQSPRSSRAGDSFNQSQPDWGLL